MKKFKLGIMGAAKFALGTSLLGYFLSLFFFALGCANARVAGITVSYDGYVIWKILNAVYGSSTDYSSVHADQF